MLLFVAMLKPTSAVGTFNCYNRVATLLTLATFPVHGGGGSGVVDLSLFLRIFRECSTSYSPPALFVLF